MINSTILVRWLPFTGTSLGIILYSLSGGNFYHNFYNFIIGDTYGLGGLSLVIVWLTSFVWVVLSGQQSTGGSAAEETGNLYRITSLRDQQLVPICARPYNDISRRVIARFKPEPTDEDQQSQKIRPEPKLLPQRPTSISGNFSDGAKKEPTDSDYSTKDESKKNGLSEKSEKPLTPNPQPLQESRLADINTALKGVSQVNDEKGQKFRANLKNFGAKRKETKQD